MRGAHACSLTVGAFGRATLAVCVCVNIVCWSSSSSMRWWRHPIIYTYKHITRNSRYMCICSAPSLSAICKNVCNACRVGCVTRARCVLCCVEYGEPAEYDVHLHLHTHSPSTDAWRVHFAFILQARFKPPRGGGEAFYTAKAESQTYYTFSHNTTPHMQCMYVLEFVHFTHRDKTAARGEPRRRRSTEFHFIFSLEISRRSRRSSSLYYHHSSSSSYPSSSSSSHSRDTG